MFGSLCFDKAFDKSVPKESGVSPLSENKTIKEEIGAMSCLVLLLEHSENSAHTPGNFHYLHTSIYSNNSPALTLRAVFTLQRWLKNCRQWSKNYILHLIDKQFGLSPDFRVNRFLV